MLTLRFGEPQGTKAQEEEEEEEEEEANFDEQKQNALW
jgi:hypothetical protein